MTTSTATSVGISRLKSWVSAGFAVVSLGALLLIGQLVPSLNGFMLHVNPQVDTLLKYQLIAVGMTLIFLLILYWLQPQNFRLFARFGDSRAHPDPVKWLGIKAADTWRSVGLNFAVVITVVTAIFIYLSFMGSTPIGTDALQWLPFALLLAVSNAFVEEALARFGIVVSLYGTLPNTTIFWVSALAFGIPHYFGAPGGVIGILMAGFLGWLLAKSLVETRGVFWAWFIHFLQDVVIFFGLLVFLTVA